MTAGPYRTPPAEASCGRCGAALDARRAPCAGCVSEQLDLLALYGVAMVTAGAITCSALLLGAGLVVPAVGAWALRHAHARRGG